MRALVIAGCTFSLRTFASVVVFAFFPWACFGQQWSGWLKTELGGNIKVVRSSFTWSRDSIDDLRTRPFDRNNFYQDSFSVTGERVLTFEVKDGSTSERWAVIQPVFTRSEEKIFDSSGRVIEERSPDGRKSTFTYDADGNVILENRYNKDTIWSVVKYTYASGLLKLQVDSSYGALHRTAYWYNEKGEKIRYETQHFGGLCEAKLVYEFTYDDRGNVTSETSNSGKTVYEYDEHNKQIAIHNYRNGTKVSSIPTEYTYDSQGNWIRRLKKSTKGYNLAVREFEYY